MVLLSNLKSRIQVEDIQNSIKWEGVEKAVSELKKDIDTSKFDPTVIVGISHGGAIVADLVGKHYHGNIPVLAISYTRNRETGKIEIPDHLFSLNLKNERVLLIDDCIISGNTMDRVFQFINELPSSSKADDIQCAVLGMNVDWRHRSCPTPLYVFDINELPFFLPWGQA